MISLCGIRRLPKVRMKRQKPRIESSARVVNSQSTYRKLGNWCHSVQWFEGKFTGKIEIHHQLYWLPVCINPQLLQFFQAQRANHSSFHYPMRNSPTKGFNDEFFPPNLGMCLCLMLSFPCIQVCIFKEDVYLIVPSGKVKVCFGQSPFLWAIFTSYVTNYQRAATVVISCHIP